MKLKAGFLLVATGLLLAGCWDSDEVTLHDGTYKGEADTAVDVASRAETLKQRFDLVQRDR